MELVVLLGLAAAAVGVLLFVVLVDEHGGSVPDRSRPIRRRIGREGRTEMDRASAGRLERLRKDLSTRR